jgi:hypothetical protein
MPGGQSGSTSPGRNARLGARSENEVML